MSVSCHTVGLVATIGKAGRIHWQLRTAAGLLSEWEFPLTDYASLTAAIEQGNLMAGGLLGSQPDFAGLAFNGNVDRRTGDASLPQVRQFGNETLSLDATAGMLGAPTVHFAIAEAAAWRLASLDELDLQIVTIEGCMPTGDDVSYGLVELDAAISTALYARNADIPEGTVRLSQGHHNMSSRTVSHEQSLSGSSGFRTQFYNLLRAASGSVPAYLVTLYNSNSREFDRRVIEFITNDPKHDFSRRFLASYGQSLGEFFGELQLYHGLDAIFVNGRVGHTAGFLELLLDEDAFLNALTGDPHDPQYAQRTELCIARIMDEDLALRGAYYRSRQCLAESVRMPHELRRAS